MGKRYSAKSFEIDEDYFLWLCALVDADDPDKGYLGILRTMYDTEFSDHTAVLIPHDENRIEDGIFLRKKFERASLYEDYSCLDGPCSVLEMMIALAMRMGDDWGYLSGPEWFWRMMGNLGLGDSTDDVYFEVDGTDRAYKILRNLRRRNYGTDGFGGLFPLKNPVSNQRETEIWNQMQAYLSENFG